MSKELLGVGDRLICVWGAWCEEGQAGGRVGFNNVVAITIDRLPGPMGYYLVAVLVRDNGKPDEVIPLHMAESFEVQNVR